MNQIQRPKLRHSTSRIDDEIKNQKNLTTEKNEKLNDKYLSKLTNIKETISSAENESGSNIKDVKLEDEIEFLANVKSSSKLVRNYSKIDNLPDPVIENKKSEKFIETLESNFSEKSNYGGEVANTHVKVIKNNKKNSPHELDEKGENHKEEISFKAKNIKGIHFSCNYNNIGSSQKLNLFTWASVDGENEFSDKYTNSSINNGPLKNIVLKVTSKRYTNEDASVGNTSTYNNSCKNTVINNSRNNVTIDNILFNNSEVFINPRGLIGDKNPRGYVLFGKEKEKKTLSIENYSNTRSDVELNLNSRQDKNIIESQNNNVFMIYYDSKEEKFFFKYLTNRINDKILFYLRLKYNKRFIIENEIIILIGNTVIKIIPGKIGRDEELVNKLPKSTEKTTSKDVLDKYTKNNSVGGDEILLYRKITNPKLKLISEKTEEKVNYDISLVKYDKDPSNNKLYKFNSSKTNITIGRSSECDIKYSDTFISKVHCRIYFDPIINKWIIYDGSEHKKSSEGTWLILNSKVPIEDEEEIKFNNNLILMKIIENEENI